MILRSSPPLWRIWDSGDMDLVSSYGDVAKALSDADVASQRDGVRGQVAAEYNRLYAHCVDHIGSSEEGNADVRYAELSVRILDRVVKLFRLDTAPVLAEEEQVDVGVSTARQINIIQAQMSELAARNRVPGGDGG